MQNQPRVAWLVPSVERGSYWQPILREFDQLCKETVFFSGDLWPNFDQTAPGASIVKTVGKMKFVASRPGEGYSRGFIYVSPSIVWHLMKFCPNVIYTSGFSLWTLLALLLKPFGKWRVVIIYDGSSPNVDTADSTTRLFARKIMARLADAFVPNTKAGRSYFVESLDVPEYKVLTLSYLVPDAQVLTQGVEGIELSQLQMQRPVFLSVGKIVPRKGIQVLLEACALLKRQDYSQYSVLIVGDGHQREALKAFAKEKEIEDRIVWINWVEYGQLGAYFNYSDVFVFPTFEDVWGMVAPEAMVFGKAVICSKWAGAVEFIQHGENGFVFDPNDPKELAEAMQQFLEQPSLITAMGEKSSQYISQHTPQSAAEFFFKTAIRLSNS